MSTQTDELELLNRVAEADEAITQAQAALIETVKDARRAKMSWALIGSALGVSRQASWERFARHMPEELR